MFSKKIFLSLLTVLFLNSVSFAIEIPLSGAVKRGKGSGNGIVFVDMEKVFNSHPMAGRFKEELKNFANTRKNAIEEMIKQHDVVQLQLREINAKIIEARTVEDEAALSELANQLDNLQKSIEQKRAEIADLSKRTKNELDLMEEKNSLAVLKDIEVVLKEVAVKHNSEVMFDKQSILYGSDKCEDVTVEVIKKLEVR
ncbi:MAG: OmpH family outer membrane protein [Endomicrobium sp.]|jgi:Skp family chaperone for outer membrane proteins|nr:OmpH family outer membrane protein [Endomicrobium sp.]